MPSPTYVAIAKATANGTSGTITFSSIPSTYTDLVILVSARANSTAVGTTILITVNSSTSSYSYRWILGNSSTAASYNATAQSSGYGGQADDDGQTASSFGSTEIYIPNYAGSTNKIFSGTGVSETNNSSANYAQIVATANLWSNTSAITSISLTEGYGGKVWNTGSRFDLYGIKNS